MPNTRKKDPKHEDDSDDEVNSAPIAKQKLQTKPTRWIFLMNNEIVQHDPDVDKKTCIETLRHPKTDSPALYLFTDEDRKVYEVTKFKEEFRSWLIEETVHSDGSIYITTPIDPLFLLLPYLIKAEQSGKFMPLDQIIKDEDYTSCDRLCTACEQCNLDYVAQVRGSDDIKAYKYDKEKTLSWLKVKTERVSDSLSVNNVHVTGAKVEDLEVSKASPEEYLRHAFGIVSDYLPLELSNSLQEYIGIPATVMKRKSDAGNPPSKRVKLEDITPIEDYSRNVKPETKTNKNKQTTNAQKKLEKVDKTGMRSLTSFFTAKS